MESGAIGLERMATEAASRIARAGFHCRVSSLPRLTRDGDGSAVPPNIPAPRPRLPMDVNGQICTPMDGVRG